MKYLLLIFMVIACSDTFNSRGINVTDSGFNSESGFSEHSGDASTFNETRESGSGPFDAGPDSISRIDSGNFLDAYVVDSQGRNETGSSIESGLRETGSEVRVDFDATSELFDSASETSVNICPNFCPFTCDCTGGSCICIGECNPGDGYCIGPSPDNQFTHQAMWCNDQYEWEPVRTCTGATGTCLDGRCIETCNGTCTLESACPTNAPVGQPVYQGGNWNYTCYNSVCSCFCSENGCSSGIYQFCGAPNCL